MIRDDCGWKTIKAQLRVAKDESSERIERLNRTDGRARKSQR